MPHHVDGAIFLPRLPADLVDQWQADSTPFTLAVNTAIPLAGQMMSYETFCESAPDSGHLLIDLFGWSKQQCQSAMLHYKLLKLQNPAVSAHFIVPAVRHIYDHGTYKPSGLIMQTCQQFTRGRRKAHVLYNPPVVRRADMQVTDDSGLSAVFQVCIAGVQARLLVDTGSEAEFVDASCAKRTGLQLHASSASPTIQLANGSTMSSTGQVSAPIAAQQYRSTLLAYVADLSALPCDILVGDPWLRKHHATVEYGPTGATGLRIIKGSKTYLLPALNATSARPEVIHLSAIQMRRQLNNDKAVRCFVVKLRNPQSYVKEGVLPDAQPIPDQPDPFKKDNPDLVSQIIMEQLKHEFDDVFQPPPDGLPPDRGTGHLIPLQPGHKPPYKNPYRLSPVEVCEVKKQVQDLLSKGWIEESQSPYGASILFVTKKDGSLRMCVDYRALNDLTIKDRSPLPRIDDLLAQLHGATVFSSIDLAQGYHQIRIAEEDVPKTGFTTPDGHYNFKVMCFGLSNAPGTFQKLMNRLLRKQLGKYVVVYLDDILIFSKTPEDHIIHLREILNILRDNKLFAKFSKCDLNMPEVLYLGHIVSKAGVAVDPKKVSAVQDWPVPKNLHDLRCFLGLTNYFRTFIQGYSARVAALTCLQSPKRSFIWDDACQTAFDGVKYDLLHAPVLKSPDLNQPFELISDACSTGIGAVLLQENRPVAFTSRKMISAELNYTTTEQECLAVIHALKVWRCFLEGQPKENLTIVTDHNPLVHLPKQTMLSRRMARWSEFLQRFVFQWQYRPGRTNVADPVSRRPDDSVVSLNAMTRSLKASNPLPGTSELEPVAAPDEAFKFKEAIQQGYVKDLWFAKADNLAPLRNDKGLWWRENAIVIPDHADIRKQLLYELHDAPYSGHLGVARTIALIEKDYWWPTLKADVSQYVKSCGDCQRNKASTQRPFGTATPLPVPESQWADISMDFITHLPKTRSGYTAIFVVVCRLSKMAHFIATHDTATAEATAKLFRDRVFCLHGMPKSIVSDRDSKFTGAFWRELHRLLRVKLRMSTANHPQTDGQTERMNRVLQDMLRHYVNKHHDDWDEYLATAEFAINNSKSSSTEETPFMLNYGRHPYVPANMTEHLRDAVLWQKDQYVPAANMFIDRMSKAITLAKEHMYAAREQQSKYASGKARPHTFEAGQHVLLSSRYIRLRSDGTPKLQPKWLGPFKLVRMVGTQAAELELPSTMKIHDVFHVSLLKPFTAAEGDLINPPVVYVDGDQEFDVDYIRAHRGSKRNRDYLVHWMGYTPEHDTWEPAAALRNAPAVVKKYWDQQHLQDS